MGVKSQGQETGAWWWLIEPKALGWCPKVTDLEVTVQKLSYIKLAVLRCVDVHCN